MDINMTVITDWSHGAQNDMYDAMKDQHLWGYWIMMLVCYNMEHGPWADDLRWAQIVDSWAEATRSFSPTEMPVFEEHLAMAVHEQGGDQAVMQSAEDGESLEMRMWRLMHSGWRAKGYKTCLIRFFATREKAATFGPWWHLSLIKYSYLIVESGMASTKKIAQLAVKPPRGPQDERAVTDSKRLDLSEKAMRASAQNALVLSCLILGDYKNCRLARCIVAITAPLHRWHAEQKRAQRKSQGNLKWLVAQLDGAFTATIAGTLAVLADIPSLQTIAFDLGNGPVSTDNATLMSFPEMFGDEDDIADVLGGLCLSLVGRRLARCAFLLRGWPLRLCGVLGSASLRAETVREFQLDLSAYEAMKLQPAERSIQGFLRRSCFNDVACQQFAEALSLARRSWLLGSLLN